MAITEKKPGAQTKTDATGTNQSLGKQPEETVTLSKDQFDKLMSVVDKIDKQEKESAIASQPLTMDGLGVMMSHFLKDQNKKTTLGKAGQFVFDSTNFDDVDETDILPEKDWKTFVCYRTGHFIVDDFKNGKPIRAPFNIITFGYSVSTRDKSGKENSIVHVSTYTCKSVKELRFLINHSRYNIDFFSKADASLDAANSSIKIMSKMSYLKNMGQADLNKYCAQYGVHFSEDLDSTRAAIAVAIVEKEDEEQRSHTQNTLNASLLGAKEVKREDDMFARK